MTRKAIKGSVATKTLGKTKIRENDSKIEIKNGRELDDEQHRRKRQKSRSHSRSPPQRSRSLSPHKEENLRGADGSPRSYRELFVGNTPTASAVKEKDLQQFLNASMQRAGLVAATENPIIMCRINPKSKFSFIEFDTSAHCTKGLNLNGIPYLGSKLKIGRPAKYNGPDKDATPPTWQQLTGTDTPVHDVTAYYDHTTKIYREIFAGNIPESTSESDLTEFITNAMVRLGFTGNYSMSCDVEEIPSPILMTKISGKFAFIETKTVEDACNMLNLNGIPFSGAHLKLHRPTKFDGTAGMGLATPIFYDWEKLYEEWKTGELRLRTSGPSSNIVLILNMATNAQLADPLTYFDVIEDSREECSTFGRVVSVIVPRLSVASASEDAAVKDWKAGQGEGGSAGGGAASALKGIGKVFVEMASEEEARQVVLGLKGRSYNGRFVDMRFYPRESFVAMNYEYRAPHLVLTESHGPTTIDAVVNDTVLTKIRHSKSHATG